MGLLLFGDHWLLVHEGGGSRSREQGSYSCGMTEIALWEMTSVRQLKFIPEYSEARTYRIWSVIIKEAMEKQIHEYRTR